MKRCPSCFGTKQVRKLGNMLGDCDTCEGKGQITDEKFTAFPRPPAIPAGNNTDVATVQQYLAQQVADNKNSIKNANVAYMNQPVLVDPKRKNDAASGQAPLPQKPIVPLDPSIKQAPDHRIAPGPMHEHELQQLRSQIQPRAIDMMASQKIEEDIATANLEDIEDAEAIEEEVATTKKSSSKKSKAKGIANGKQERIATGT